MTSLHRALCAGLAAVVTLAVTASNGPAAAQTASLSAEDKQDIKRIEEFFNQIGTLQARFIQLSPNGRFHQGSLYWVRPAQLRFEYDTLPYYLIADNGRLIFYDKEIESPAYLSVDDTPLEFLLADQVSLTDGVTVTGVERGPGSLRVTMVQTASPEAGAVQMTFSERPFGLKKWSIIDSHGTALHIAILEPRFDVALDPKLFEFKNPNIYRDPKREELNAK